MEASPTIIPFGPVSGPGPIARILCAINGSRGSAEAVRQALALAGHGTSVHFVAVTDVCGVGLNRMAGVGEHRAHQALDAARALARDKAVSSTTELVYAQDVVGTLIEMQAATDLLAVGCHAHSRRSGILTGSITTKLAHRTVGPLLVARPRTSTEPFPAKLLVAVAEDPAALNLVELAGRLAAASGGSVHIAHVAGREYDSATRRLLADLAVGAWQITGTEPVVDTLIGRPVERLAYEVARVRPDLLVVGRRGVDGLQALGSVSERLLHLVACSVMIAGSG